MQIQLKQVEIVAALKQYIASQGINLNNKTVDISFTASRGTAGLVADLQIEDNGQAPVTIEYQPIPAPEEVDVSEDIVQTAAPAAVSLFS